MSGASFKRKIRAWRGGATWSPDGKRFAYVYRDWDRRKFGLYLGRFGEEEPNLSRMGSHLRGLRMVQKIACSVPHALGARLIFINVDTQDREQPLSDKALLWQYSPSWSAAGDKLAISGNKHPIPVILDRELHNAWKDKTTVYLVNRDGTGLQQLG